MFLESFLAVLAMCFFVIDQITGVMKGSVAAIAFERLDSRVSVEVHLECLSPCKLFSAHFAYKLSFISVSFSMAIAISNA